MFPLAEILGQDHVTQNSWFIKTHKSPLLNLKHSDHGDNIIISTIGPFLLFPSMRLLRLRDTIHHRKKFIELLSRLKMFSLKI